MPRKVPGRAPAPTAPQTPPSPPDADELAAAQAFFDEAEEAEAVNLDEVVPQPVRVAVIERVPVQEEEEDGAGGTRTVERRRLRKRVAVIETYVPLDVYDRMMAARARFQAQVAHVTREEGDRLAIGFMIEAVADVWALTEPDMTVERLRAMLDPFAARTLFSRFFGPALRKLASRAGVAASGTRASA